MCVCTENAVKSDLSKQTRNDGYLPERVDFSLKNSIHQKEKNTVSVCVRAHAVPVFRIENKLRTRGMLRRPGFRNLLMFLDTSPNCTRHAAVVGVMRNKMWFESCNDRVRRFTGTWLGARATLLLSFYILYVCIYPYIRIGLHDFVERFLFPFRRYIVNQIIAPRSLLLKSLRGVVVFFFHFFKSLWRRRREQLCSIILL